MNTLHYPSLELCKKLQSEGFPETEKFWTRSLKWDEESKTFPYEIFSRPTPGGYYICPSVMELLDEMPYKFDIVQKNNEFTIRYINNFLVKHANTNTLPNALAEMWLWLKENNYLPTK